MTHKNTSSFCPLRAVGSGGCVRTGFWITTPCPSVTSGGVCLETSMLPMRGTMAGSSSLKVSNTHTIMHTLINAWFSTHNSQNMFSSSLRPVVFNSQKQNFYVLKDNMVDGFATQKITTHTKKHILYHALFTVFWLPLR